MTILILGIVVIVVAIVGDNLLNLSKTQVVSWATGLTGLLGLFGVDAPQGDIVAAINQIYDSAAILSAEAEKVATHSTAAWMAISGALGIWLRRITSTGAGLFKKDE